MRLLCVCLAAACQASITTIDDHIPTDFNSIQAGITEAGEAGWFNEVQISCREPLFAGSFTFSLIPPLNTPPCDSIECADLAFLTVSVDCQRCMTLGCEGGRHCILEQLLGLINAQGADVWRANQTTPGSLRIYGPEPFDICIWSPEMSLAIGLGLPLTMDCQVNNLCNGISGDEQSPDTVGYAFHVLNVNIVYLGDFDEDGDVDFYDYAVLARAWRTSPGELAWNPTCDISDPNDNVIDHRDLTAFTTCWLTGVE